MQYNGNTPMYLQKGNFNGKETYVGAPRFDTPADIEKYKTFYAGDAIGYILTDFTYPGELIANPGDSITSILDKIKNLLGNFEYFYDLDGKFIFQEIKNY
jgi:hypothetical protein